MTADSGEQAHSGRAAWAARLRSWGESAPGELWLRVITAGVGVPVIVAVILVGDELLAAALSLAFAVAYLEFSHSMGLALSRPTVWIGAGGVVSMIAVALVADVPTTWPLTAAVLALLAVPVIEELVRSHRPGRGEPPPFATMYRQGGLSIGGLIYVGWLGSFFMLLSEFPAGDEWLLLAIFAVMATDTGAFAVGRVAGRHRLAPRISPNKTVEGALGGWVVGFTAVILLRYLPNVEVEYWKMVLLALALPPAAQIGDLAASVIKRAVEVKDFSRLIPGHGGVLDRLDSMLVGVPVVYFFVRWVVL